MSNLLRFIISVGVCEAAGIIGAIYATPAINTWYSTLNKPSFSPPDYVFGPVWTILYFLMGVSLYLVWKNKDAKKKSVRKDTILVFISQLVTNVLWSVVFFGMRFTGGGLIVIIFLWLLIFFTIKGFVKVDKNASYLLYPYLVWVTFAVILNFNFWILNR